MPIRKGTKRTWEAGRPRIQGGPVRRLFVITEEQDKFLEGRENASEFIRHLIDKEMVRSQKRATVGKK